MTNFSKGASGTFALNKSEAIHRWYPYLEGYSFSLIENIINEIGENNIHSIYDPFCGTGTTPLVASNHGITSFYSETNPFMCKVIEAKINSVKRLRDSKIGSKHLRKFLSDLKKESMPIFDEPIEWDGFEKYFEPEVLMTLKWLISKVNNISDEDTKSIVFIILASVIVRASKMIRQGDLRYAKENEKNDLDRDILGNFTNKLQAAIEDIESTVCPTRSKTLCLNEDARKIDVENLVDCVITSPPYLNGTNYIRNTKLELKLFGFITTESDLPQFHSKGIIAGINNVSKRKNNFATLDCIVKYLDALKPVSYDDRIQTMVSGYFNDMDCVVERLSHILRDKGYFVMDIGDSQFAGVHIPTHEILVQICKSHGFELYNEEVLRKRRSKNGMILTQRLLKFRLHKKFDINATFKSEAKVFIKEMPHHDKPYDGRNWGHQWHSLCSYHGKLKPAIAHFLIDKFTNPGDVVLDPLCGVGTIPFEACLQGRIGIGNDLSEMAFAVTKAKVEKPTLEDSLNSLSQLAEFIRINLFSAWVDEDARKYQEFGLNGNVSEYFHLETFREILCARRYFKERLMTISSPESMVFSCLLHVLHGNRPYALSRKSHPLTPYAPTGEFTYKNLIEHVREKLIKTYKGGDFDRYISGKAIFGDYHDLKKKKVLADVIICSPPFADSIRFYTQNWLRLWLCGWDAENFKKADSLFLDQKQIKNFDEYNSFFQMCADVLKPQGKVILHLGKTKKINMAEELSRKATALFDVIYEGEENVTSIEKHGIKDKGGVIKHQYLFLMKK